MDTIDQLNGEILQNRFQQEEMERQARTFYRAEDTFETLLQEKEQLQFEIQETWQGSERFPILQAQQLELKRVQNLVLEELDLEKSRIRQERLQLEETEDLLLRKRQQAWTKGEQK
ncbi:hypothetical protein ACYRFT_00465 [Listeria kieliensis]